MKKKSKPKYSLRQNLRFMVHMAWKNRKSVLFFCVSIAVLQTGVNLTQLFLAPQILEDVEQAVPLSDLLGTIVRFSVALFVLMGLTEYCSQLAIEGRIHVRAKINTAINHKHCTTSYPNTCDPAVMSLFKNALNTTISGQYSAAQHIWMILTMILKSAAGFILYLALMPEQNPILIAVILTTSVGGFFLTMKLYQWGYHHRDDRGKYLNRFLYISGKAESNTLAKDIRIFGLKPWLLEIQDGAIRMYEDFVNKVSLSRLAADALNVLLTVARNGIAFPGSAEYPG